jgi:excisionase family DNA binding protein
MVNLNTDNLKYTLFTVEESAKILGVSKDFIYDRLLRRRFSRMIYGIKIRDTWRIPKKSLKEFILKYGTLNIYE